ncbi:MULTISPECIES: cation:proton antiporter regulatory subunit [Cohnella]|uniref:cation:proton antiporter regulatory subunit n=1 Tax=Cohnella TaxID=329857 RepID=UPI0009BBFAC8|nr:MULTISPECIES: cation:proton antiporter regulatory subunit [Cohnella]MBN2980318.1 cation:proton antiporter regulatory subunit [Cohnella algarum]
MNIRESELPAIGRKFQMVADSGDKLVIIVHDDGRREIYHFDHDDPDDSISMVTLTDEESRQVAGIIGGLSYKPKSLENIEMAFDELVIEWYKLEPASKCVGKTIGELNIRKNSGVTVIAVVAKNQQKQTNPGPDYVLTPEATIVVMGERHQQKKFKEILANGGG